MSNKESKVIFKYNNGNGAILCSKCAKIIKTLHEFSDVELNVCKGEIELNAYYCDDCIKYRSEIKTYDDFISSLNKNILINDNLKYKRKGQLLMNFISEVWFDEYVKIDSNIELDCYYDDNKIDKTLEYLKKEWKNF